MASAIEEYKYRLKSKICVTDECQAGFVLGFDSAMGLNLPVVFIKWQQDERYYYDPSSKSYIAAWDNYKEFTPEELYKEFLNTYNRCAP